MRSEELAKLYKVGSQYKAEGTPSEARKRSRGTPLVRVKG